MFYRRQIGTIVRLGDMFGAATGHSIGLLWVPAWLGRLLYGPEIVEIRYVGSVAWPVFRDEETGEVAATAIQGWLGDVARKYEHDRTEALSS